MHLLTVERPCTEAALLSSPNLEPGISSHEKPQFQVIEAPKTVTEREMTFGDAQLISVLCLSTQDL